MNCPCCQKELSPITKDTEDCYECSISTYTINNILILIVFYLEFNNKMYYMDLCMESKELRIGRQEELNCGNYMYITNSWNPALFTTSNIEFPKNKQEAQQILERILTKIMIFL